MKKCSQFTAAILLICILLNIAGCSRHREAEETYRQETTVIGVAVYNTKDPEVLAFRDYFKNYLSSCFNVSFLYSDSIRSAEDETAFVTQAADAGAKGIVSFITYDLSDTVALCEEKQIYYMMGSGTVAPEAFDAVKDSPHFLGVIGPDEDIERQAGQDMAAFFAGRDENKTDRYLIFTGGGSMGNVMHQYRTEAILTCLAKQYGLALEQPVSALAVSPEPVTLTGENHVSVTLFPGYVSREEIRKAGEKQIADADYSVILSVLGLSDLYDNIKAEQSRRPGLSVGVIDCFSEQNLHAAQDGYLCYVTGKYPSLVGPSFAAIYDAIHGNGDQYKNGTEAFRLTQGFWTADNAKSYAQMYGYTVSNSLNAYSGDDLIGVMKLFTASATFDDFKALTEAYRIEDIRERRQ